MSGFLPMSWLRAAGRTLISPYLDLFKDSSNSSPRSKRNVLCNRQSIHMKKSLIALIALTASSPAVAQRTKGYVTNIDKTTVENEAFRRVLFTGSHSQLVVMSLKQGEEIGRETHKVDQFFRIEQGSAVLTMGDKDYKVGKDSAFIVPAGTAHNVKNVGDEKLKLYTIYSPPQHAAGTIHHTQSDAIEAESKHK